jgi:predicted dehydrogenase
MDVISNFDGDYVMAKPVQEPVVVVVGGGAKIAAPHLKALMREFTTACSGGWRIGVCSSSPDVRAGRLNRGNNLKITIPEQVDPAIWAEVIKYGSINEAMVDPNVVAAIICTPTAYHLEHATAFTNQEKHVLIEKPFGLDPHAIKEFLAVVPRKVHVGVAHNLLGFPPYRALSSVLDKGVRITGGEMSRLVCRSNPINQPANRAIFGSAPDDLLPHNLHCLLSKFGNPLSAQVLEVRRLPNDSTFINRVKVKLTYPFGEIIVTDGAMENDNEEFRHSFDFTTSDGARILMSPETGWAAKLQAEGSTTDLPVPSNFEGAKSDAAPFYLEQEIFLNVVSGATRDLAQLDPHLALRTMQLVTAIMRQAGGNPMGWTRIPASRIFT